MFNDHNIPSNNPTEEAIDNFCNALAVLLKECLQVQNSSPIANQPREINPEWSRLPTMLTVKEAAEVARTSMNQVYRLCRTKGFPCKRFEKMIRIPRDEYRTWLEKSTTGQWW